MGSRHTEAVRVYSERLLASKVRDSVQPIFVLAHYKQTLSHPIQLARPVDSHHGTAHRYRQLWELLQEGEEQAAPAHPLELATACAPGPALRCCGRRVYVPPAGDAWSEAR